MTSKIKSILEILLGLIASIGFQSQKYSRIKYVTNDFPFTIYLLRKSVRHLFCKAVLAFAVCMIVSCASSNEGPVFSAEKPKYCGPQTPTHFYVTEVAPTLDYPDSVFFDISKFPSWEKPKTPAGHNNPIGPPRSAKVRYEKIQAKYSLQELECWSEAGDQLALTFNRAYKAKPALWNHVNRYGFFNRGYQISEENPRYNTINTKTVLTENSEIVGLWLKDLVRASSIRDDYCVVTIDGFNSSSENCRPDTMLAVLEHGLPEAHYFKYVVYYGGGEYQDADKARDALLMAALMGHARAYQSLNPFICKHYNRIKKNVRLKLLFEAQYEAYAPLHYNPIGNLEEGLCHFPLGYPGAHESLFEFYYSGPPQYRNADKAYYHRLVASISGRSDPYMIGPYSCKHADIYNTSRQLSEQLIRILKVDVNLSARDKEKKLSELKKCLTLI